MFCLLVSMEGKSNVTVLFQTSKPFSMIQGYLVYFRRFLLFLVAAFGWLSLILFAAFGNVLVNESIYGPLLITGLTLSFFVCIFVFSGAFSKNSFLKKVLNLSGYASWVTCLGLLLAIPMVITFPLAKGMPTVAHLPLATEGVIRVTVKGKTDLYLARGCSGRIYLEEFSLFGNHFICGLGKSEWSALNSGDSLELHGTSSIFGFRYVGYKLPKGGQ